jgi:hypothetical protein
VANATEENLDLHVAGTRHAPLKGERTERRGCALSGVSKGFGHGLLVQRFKPGSRWFNCAHWISPYASLCANKLTLQSGNEKMSEANWFNIQRKNVTPSLTILEHWMLRANRLTIHCHIR